MSFTDRFLPPPGAPGAIRDAAGAWRDCAGRVRALGDEVNARASVLSSSWWGPSKGAFVAQTWPFLRQVDAAAADLEQYAGLLDRLADGIDAAQREFHARMIAVGATLVIGAALTFFTATLSDEAALAAVTAEVATATELATTAATEALAALSWLTAQASQLGLRVLVFSGVNVAGDAVGAGVAYGDGRPWAHLHLREDVEWGAIGGVAVPLGAGMLGGLAAQGVSLVGGYGAAIKLGVGGLSMAQADVLVRSALGEHVDPGELAMAALPLGAAGSPRGLPPADLLVHEEAGGHTLGRHVGKSDAELLARLDQSHGTITGVSTFYDKEHADMAVAEVLARNEDRLSAWLVSPLHKLRLQGDTSTVVGRYVGQGHTTAGDVDAAFVVLVKNSSLPWGYTVLTSYPVPRSS